MIDGSIIYGSGRSIYLGIEETIDVDVSTPVKLNFVGDFEAFHIFPSNRFTIMCTEGYSECYGFGDNSYCAFAGCEVGESLKYSPISIFRENLHNFMRDNMESFEIKNIYVSLYQTIVSFQHTVEGYYYLFSTGDNTFGVLSQGQSDDYMTWGQMKYHSMSGISECFAHQIKFIEFLSNRNVYIVTSDNQWFVGGSVKTSTCPSFFLDDIILTINGIPLDTSCSSGVYENELIGDYDRMDNMDILDFKCSYHICLCLVTSNNIQKEYKLYSWGWSDIDTEIYCDHYLGRTIMDQTEQFYFPYVQMPSKVNMTQYFDLQRSEPQLFEIEGIFITEKFSFISVMDEGQNRKRIFGFGKDDDDENYYGFHQDSTEFIVELFSEENNYKFTKFMNLSSGKFQHYSIMIQDSTFCDSSFCSKHGECYDFGDFCECEEHYNTSSHCEDYYCFDILFNSSNVCSRNGKCIEYNQCECFFNQTGVTANCSIPNCYGFAANDSRACNGNGYCIGEDNCDCFIGIGTFNCSIYKCFGHYTDSPSVCSGRGTCIGPNDCNCDEDYFGEKCEKQQKDYFGTILAITFPAVFSVLTGLLCLFCLICLIGWIGICLCAVYFLRIRRKMKRFLSLKNVDLLIEEQKLADSGEIAHITINKDIFNLDISV